MDYYSTLGLKRGASPDDIKKAYRSMAMKHHPDRGGDERKFKEVEEAYRTLSDPEKKKMVDMGLDPNSQAAQGFSGFGQGPFEFHFNTGNFDDLFGQFGFGMPRRPRNKSFNVGVELTLEEILTGKDVNAELGLPGGIKKFVNITIPAGIEHGQSIRYQGMGDHSLKESPAGDLIVNVRIKPHKRFKREGDNILYDCRLSVWDAILGTNISLETLDKKIINIAVPPGTQPETVLSCKGEGLPNVKSKMRGNLLIKISLDIPRNLTESQKLMVKNLKDGL
jgi:curved DNA-binding protein